MKIDFTKPKLHLVITPLDMRLGFNRLSEIALVYLHINIKKGRDLVAFVSKNCKIAKIIGYDCIPPVFGPVRATRWIDSRF